MKKEESKVIAQKLQKIPNGTLALKHCRSGERVAHSLENSFERLPLEKGVWRHMKLFLE